MQSIRPHLFAALTAMLALAGCGAAVQTQRADELAAQGDVDGAVTAYREALAAAPSGSDQSEAQARLQAAVSIAVRVHLGVAEQALKARDLTSAESETQKAAAMAADDERVKDVQGKVGAVRRQGDEALTNSRARLQRLTAEPVQPENRSEWQALVADLEWLHDWQLAFPDAAKLLHESAEPVAEYFVAEARQQFALGDGDAARALQQKALKRVPNHKSAEAFRAEMDAADAVARTVRDGNELLAQAKFDEAAAAFGTALQASPGLPAARQGLVETKRQWILALLAQFVESEKTGQAAASLTWLDGARRVAAGDAAAQAHVRQVGAALQARMAEQVRARLAAAVKHKLPGAVLAYASVLLSLLPEDPQGQAAVAAFEPGALARIAYRVAVPAPRPPKGAPPGAAAALQEELAKRLQGDWAAANHVTVVIPPASTRKARHKDKAPKADAQIVSDLVDLAIERQDAPERRVKTYVDHTDLVDNDAWTLAQGQQSSALTRLNVATDAMRPVQMEVNRAEASLSQLQLQLAEIRGKILEEDKAFYAGKPSPCPERTLSCEATRGHKRWSANVAYYQRGIQRETETLLKSNPELATLTAAVDAAQKAFDAAQRLAAETPRQISKEISYDHAYEVTKQDAGLRARLTLTWMVDGQSKAAGQASLAETLTDYSNDHIEIKGHILEQAKPASLPDDAVLLAQMAGKLLDGALPPLLDALRGQGDRLQGAVNGAKSELGRVDALMLVALAGAAVSPQVREPALRELLEKTGWDAVAGMAVLERLAGREVPAPTVAPAASKPAAKARPPKRSKSR